MGICIFARGWISILLMSAKKFQICITKSIFFADSNLTEQLQTYNNKKMVLEMCLHKQICISSIDYHVISVDWKKYKKS